jgi:3',5'-cyclic-AMP phosphodiesterase
VIIAQLSDIHADGSSERLDRLERVLEWLEPLKPDALIVSGDLAEEEHRESYRKVRSRLESLGAPVIVVPGNVDDRGQLREAFGDSHDWADAGPLNHAAVIGGIKIIGLDVTVPGAHHGDAAPVLPWLRKQLATGSEPTMIFQHQHPFLCGIDNKDRNICFNADGLADAILAAGDRVQLLTCGHVHRAMSTIFAGRRATMAPSVTQANKLRLDGKEPTISDPPGLLLHHWQDDRLVSHVVMVR